MNEDRFESFLKDALDDLDPVPPTPREEMWARIEGQRSFKRQVSKPGKHENRTWISWGVGLAAMLAVGVGIGRLSVTGEKHEGVRVAHVSGPSNAAPVNRTAYRLAVAEYMTSADALLTSFRTQPRGSLDPDIAVQARDLLTNTRLLLDSPAADDPKVAALLEDLELIIAQIARMSAPSTEEREIIRDGMNKTAVLPRLRATQPAVGT